jgi:hypothetical protein
VPVLREGDQIMIVKLNSSFRDGAGRLCVGRDGRELMGW